MIERWTTDDDVVVRTARKRWDCSGDGRLTPDHAPGCAGVIEPGERCVEYSGEAVAYESGSRHSLACAVHFGYIDPTEKDA